MLKDKLSEVCVNCKGISETGDVSIAYEDVFLTDQFTTLSFQEPLCDANIYLKCFCKKRVV